MSDTFRTIERNDGAGPVPTGKTGTIALTPEPTDTWTDCYREDLSDTVHVHAVFYTVAEAEAFIRALSGMMHCGGPRADFRIELVELDGEGVTYRNEFVMMQDTPAPDASCAPFADRPASPTRDRQLDAWRRS